MKHTFRATHAISENIGLRTFKVFFKLRGTSILLISLDSSKGYAFTAISLGYKTVRIKRILAHLAITKKHHLCFNFRPYTNKFLKSSQTMP